MRLADFIEQHAREIVAGAVSFAETQAPAGMPLSARELRNHLPLILDAIVRDLRTEQSASEQHAKSEGRAPASVGPETAASHHGRTRARSGFGVNQMVAEYRALRAAVLRLWADDRALLAGSIQDLMRFNEAIDQAIAESLAEYSAEVDSWREVFLGALGHELRGPLAALMINAELLARTAHDSSHARQLDVIRDSGKRMTSLLDDLLDYSRSKLGAGMVLRLEDCDLTKVLAEEVELLRAALPEASIRFDAKGPTTARLDASRLREALHNLVTNAVKYGDAGKDIVIRASGTADELLVQVASPGPALSEGARRVIFDPLRRGAERASQGEHASLGPGLFLVREIARRTAAASMRRLRMA
ncbi:sensor histidine kinase [Luteimonas sp. FCS-9]|uniref:sensor histidine kinase n=1 Tax=Luteimonas sp. FCS-9 TaxID=1547516 RepID=UPI000AA11F5A|nr:sensor histidine kinase [Luteimonas sp. FCS-9]